MTILDKNKKTLRWLLLSTSIATLSITETMAGVSTLPSGWVAGPGEQEEYDADNGNPIFYVPASDITGGEYAGGSGGEYGHGIAYFHYNGAYYTANIDYRDGKYVVLGPEGQAIDDFLNVANTNFTTAQVNSMLATIASASAANAATDVAQNTFKSAKAHLNRPSSLIKLLSSSKKQDNVTKAQSIFKAISDTGPMDISNDRYRLWVAPFSDHVNSTGSSASREWTLGVLSGFQYDSLENSYTIGGIVGFHFGHQRSKFIKENGTNLTGTSVGMYGSYGAWKGGRIDAVVMHLRNKLSSSRLTIQGLAKSEKDLNINVVNLQTSHVFKLPDDQWSVRFSIGNAYVEDKTSAYTERGAGNQNMRHSGASSKSSEVIGGVGLRWNLQGETWRNRITGLYELGKEYSKTGSTSRVSFGNNFSNSITSRNTEKAQTTQYLSLYTTVNNKTGLKFYLGYAGTFAKNSIGTAFTAKAEYRF